MATLLETIAKNYSQLQSDARIAPKSKNEQSQKWADALKKGIVLFYDHQEVQTGTQYIEMWPHQQRCGTRNHQSQPWQNPTGVHPPRHDIDSQRTITH